MLRGVQKLVLVGMAVLVLPLVAACQTAPATGRQIFTAGLGPEDEQKLGLQEHPKILKEFGGDYEEIPELSAYVTSIGDLLAKTSELPNQKFTFTVLDTPIVNAFALPGGYVYITRGLLALADNEAEVAGVLAHEIGHVTARHSAERYGNTVVAGVAAAVAGVLIGGPAAQAAGGAAGLALQSYSRDQEFEADMLGVRYLSRAGYDPGGMSSFLAKLQAHSRLEAELRGKPGEADKFDIMQTHPRTADRIRKAAQAAGEKPVANPIVARDIYLSKIDGMLYGDDPEQGIIQDNGFSHPELGFAFEVPESFRLFNSSNAVLALGPQDSRIIFTGAADDRGIGPARHIREIWAPKAKLSRVENLDINGMPAATATTSINSRGGRLDGRLVAISYDEGTIYRFLFATPPSATRSLSVDLRRTTYSFRRLSDAEAAAIKPNRLRIHTVRRGDTVSALAGRMPFSDLPEKRFRTLNGLAPEAGLKVGEKVKLVVQ